MLSVDYRRIIGDVDDFLIGVQYDHDSDAKTIQLQAGTYDPTWQYCMICYAPTDRPIVLSIDRLQYIGGDKLLWSITRNTTRGTGIVLAQITATDTLYNKVWQTQMAKFEILQSWYNGVDIPSPYDASCCDAILLEIQKIYGYVKNVDCYISGGHLYLDIATGDPDQPLKTIDCGQVLINPRGKWDASETYAIMDAVVNGDGDGYILLGTPADPAIDPQDDPAWVLYVEGARGGIPNGGDTGQVLSKMSPDDLDVDWLTPYYVPATDGQPGQVLTKTGDNSYQWMDTISGIAPYSNAHNYQQWEPFYMPTAEGWAYRVYTTIVAHTAEDYDPDHNVCISDYLYIQGDNLMYNDINQRFSTDQLSQGNNILIPAPLQLSINNPPANLSGLAARTDTGDPATMTIRSYNTSSALIISAGAGDARPTSVQYIQYAGQQQYYDWYINGQYTNLSRINININLWYHRDTWIDISGNVPLSWQKWLFHAFSLSWSDKTYNNNQFFALLQDEVGEIANYSTNAQDAINDLYNIITPPDSNYVLTSQGNNAIWQRYRNTITVLIRSSDWVQISTIDDYQYITYIDTQGLTVYNNSTIVGNINNDVSSATRRKLHNVINRYDANTLAIYAYSQPLTDVPITITWV